MSLPVQAFPVGSRDHPPADCTRIVSIIPSDSDGQASFLSSFLFLLIDDYLCTAIIIHCVMAKFYLPESPVAFGLLINNVLAQGRRRRVTCGCMSV